MQDNEFEWDDLKAKANPKAHKGVSFIQARLVFKDSYAVEIYDDREDYGEDRLNRIGLANGVLLFVTYTMRGHRKRIISARLPEKHEAEFYYSENQLYDE